MKDKEGFLTPTQQRENRERLRKESNEHVTWSLGLKSATAVASCPPTPPAKPGELAPVISIADWLARRFKKEEDDGNV